MLKARTEQYQPAGVIVESHGLEGDVIAEFDFLYDEVFKLPDLLWVINSNQMMIPLRIESIWPNEANPQQFFVHFVNINDRQQAVALKNKKLFVESRIIRPAEQSNQCTFDFIGYELIDTSANISAPVVDIMDNPAHAILVLGNNMLVPFVDEYIEKVDDEGRKIYGHNLELLTGL